MKRKAPPKAQFEAMLKRLAAFSGKSRPPTKAELDRLKAAMEPLRNVFAEYGRIGGKMGAEARWANVSEAKRREGARKAALARWAKARKKRSW